MVNPNNFLRKLKSFFTSYQLKENKIYEEQMKVLIKKKITEIIYFRYDIDSYEFINTKRNGNFTFMLQTEEQKYINGVNRLADEFYFDFIKRTQFPLNEIRKVINSEIKERTISVVCKNCGSVQCETFKPEEREEKI